MIPLITWPLCPGIYQDPPRCAPIIYILPYLPQDLSKPMAHQVPLTLLLLCTLSLQVCASALKVVPRQADDSDLLSTVTTKAKTSTTTRAPTGTARSEGSLSSGDNFQTPMFAILIVLLVISVINSSVIAYLLYRRFQKKRKVSGTRPTEATATSTAEGAGAGASESMTATAGGGSWFGRLIPFTMASNSNTPTNERPLPSIPVADKKEDSKGKFVRFLLFPSGKEITGAGWAFAEFWNYLILLGAKKGESSGSNTAGGPSLPAKDDSNESKA
ncbi:hypothetical protein BJ742DRAFT_300769 [Cladochytrium replicatum]|nr:hypothetical protein BJ742DRAFT_300769 [Cladochytrium replicatum]